MAELLDYEGSNPPRSANESLSPERIRLRRRNSPRVGLFGESSKAGTVALLHSAGTA
jgi:hypothetical protein